MMVMVVVAWVALIVAGPFQDLVEPAVGVALIVPVAVVGRLAVVLVRFVVKFVLVGQMREGLLVPPQLGVVQMTVIEEVVGVAAWSTWWWMCFVEVGNAQVNWVLQRLQMCFVYLVGLRVEVVFHLYLLVDVLWVVEE